MASLRLFMLLLLITNCQEYECKNSLDYQCHRQLAAQKAIYSLHKLLDSDKDGGISPKETKGFAIEELKDTVPSERIEKLYESDLHINPEELWFVWKNSEIYNWTIDDVKTWLIDRVNLPQYVDTFTSHHIDGKSLPLLIMSDGSFMSETMEIKNLVHRQKIILKTTDIILFGRQQDSQNPIKDSILVACIIVVITGSIFGFRKVSFHKSQMEKISRELEKMALLERSMTELQKLLDESQLNSQKAYFGKYPLIKKPSVIQLTKIEHTINSAKPISQEDIAKENSKEISFLRQILVEKQQQLEAVLRRATEEISSTTQPFVQDEPKSDDETINSELDDLSTSGRTMTHEDSCLALKPISDLSPNYSKERYSIELRLWLQISYEVEMNFYNVKKSRAERQLKEAREACEKLNRKQKSIIGTLRIAHFSAMEDLDSQINKTKDTLDEIRQDLDENRQRWNEIQRLLGIQLVPTPGLSVLRKNLDFYRKANLELTIKQSQQKHLVLGSPLEDNNNKPVKFQCTPHSSCSSNLNELGQQMVAGKQCCLRQSIHSKCLPTY